MAFAPGSIVQMLTMLRELYATANKGDADFFFRLVGSGGTGASFLPSADRDHLSLLLKNLSFL